MTFALVAAGGGNTGFTFPAAQTLVLTLGQAVGTGNLICGGVTQGDAANLVSVIDNATPPNIYHIINATQNDGLAPAIAIFYLGNVRNNPTEITATWSNANAALCAVVADEFAGASALAGADPLDQSNGGPLQHTPGTGANAVTSGVTPALTQIHDLVYGVGANNGNGDINIGTSPNAFISGQYSTVPGNNFLRSELRLDIFY